MSRISGPGGPHDKDQVVVDATDAVLLENTNVVMLGAIRQGHMDEVILGLELEGRINKKEERSSVLYLFDADGAAAIVTELIGLAQRLGPEFMEHFSKRMAAMP